MKKKRVSEKIVITNDVFQEFNDSPIETQMRFLHSLFQEAIHFREDAWFHYQDGLPYEILNIDKLQLLGQLLKNMSEHKGKLVWIYDT